MKLHILLLSIFVVPAFAGSYTLSPQANDHGGLRGTSTHYTADFSAMPGGAGSSTSYIDRSGYAGQLGDVIATAIYLEPVPKAGVFQSGRFPRTCGDFRAA